MREFVSSGMVFSRRRLSLAVLSVLAGCSSPQYALLQKEHADDANTGGAASGDVNGDTEPASTGASGSESAGVSAADTTVAGWETTGTSTGTTDVTNTMDAISTTQTSTGEPMAVCGNAVVEAFGAEPEECDDGNLDPDDGCNDTCALDRRVFVTSIRYSSGELQSLKIADALCFNRADDQGWPDALKYRAWLSDSTTDAKDRFKQGRGRLVLVTGLVLAASWSALLAGELEHAFEVTEKNETYHGGVWTGTRPDGTAVPGSEHCEDWSTNWYKNTGHYGYSDRMTSEWTLSQDDDNPIVCGVDFALYCLQTL
ncbi:MAG: hypothetical protein H0T76_19075 [Nannocystis sp.]|nr:DUF4215 domain-containing protein [Nannocystis sp.]MBA3548592.1 hypothetical protein [Nannocystis sp.]